MNTVTISLEEFDELRNFKKAHSGDCLLIDYGSGIPAKFYTGNKEMLEIGKRKRYFSDKRKRLAVHKEISGKIFM